MDAALHLVGGAAALDEFDSPYDAAAIEDTLFEHGATGGAAIIREAINAVIGATPSEQLALLGITGSLDYTGRADAATFAVLQALMNGGYGPELRDALADKRDIALRSKERWRMDYFRFGTH
jgi:hypothetical protein